MKLRLTRKIVFRTIIVALILWALVLPFLFQKQSDEKLSDIPVAQPRAATASPSAATTETEPVTIAKGTLRGMNGQSGSGDVLLLKQGDKHYVRLEANFIVSSGPDLFVATGKDGKVIKLIEKLRGTSGGQNFELPVDADPASFDQIFIHCRAFQYSFAVADLTSS